MELLGRPRELRAEVLHEIVHKVSLAEEEVELQVLAVAAQGKLVGEELHEPSIRGGRGGVHAALELRVVLGLREPRVEGGDTTGRLGGALGARGGRGTLTQARALLRTRERPLLGQADRPLLRERRVHKAREHRLAQLVALLPHGLERRLTLLHKELTVRVS